jgi:superoxide dismutase, Cu-Zn family
MNAIAIFDPSASTNAGKISGSIKFYQASKDSSTFCLIDLKGFKPNSTHGFHIHEYGEITTCKDCGGHYNPYGKQHGSYLYDGNNRHAGDLTNNLVTDENGNCKFILEDNLISLFPRYQVFDTIIGRSVVIHLDKDDLGLGNNAESKISGNAGKRICCSVIGISKPEPFKI